MVLLDHVDADDLVRYRAIVQSMPRSELACGFVGSERVLTAWPRHELFQFYHDTHAIFGALPDVSPFTEADALEAALIGASGSYHATCHACVFDGDTADGILESLFKGAFFTLQALQFARTGAYPRTKAELATQLEGDEARILEVGRDWQAHRPKDDVERRELVYLLLRCRKASSSNSRMRKSDCPFSHSDLRLGAVSPMAPASMKARYSSSRSSMTPARRRIASSMFSGVS